MLNLGRVVLVAVDEAPFPAFNRGDFLSSAGFKVVVFAAAPCQRSAARRCAFPLNRGFGSPTPLAEVENTSLELRSLLEGFMTQRGSLPTQTLHASMGDLKHRWVSQ